MIVHKFGGASVKDAKAILRMAEICKTNISNGIVVVSAMGKSTNLLEKITDRFYSGLSTVILVDELKEYYVNVLTDLFTPEHYIYNQLNTLLKDLFYWLNRKPGLNFDFEYDQIVSYGELISTQIISSFLKSKNYNVVLIDIRNSLKTDSTYRGAKVNWELSAELIRQEFNSTSSTIYLTQGFIGVDMNNLTTTLGREGSDFTAAILANVLDAEKVVVWKDVPGILCADPKWMPNTEKLDEISYLEAIELAFFGAKVIHPKTIKPLENKNIPLHVKSFFDPLSSGTLIHNMQAGKIPPVFIKKDNQILISIKPLDFSFILEENLSHIFGVFAKHQISVNVMQNSAISFSTAVDGEVDRVHEAIRELKKNYDVKYNDNLKLISIRHTTLQSEQKVLLNHEVLLEQRSRSAARFVLRETTSD